MAFVKPLPRRTFLKGVGVTLALPFLEAMLPFNRSWAAEPSRFGVFFKGLGMRSDPANTTAIRTIHPEILQILSPFANLSTTITGLQNHAVTNNHDEIAGFMAGTKPTGYKQASSIDRVFADLLGAGTVFRDGLCVGSEARGATQSTIFRALSQKKGSQTTHYSDPRVLFDLITNLGGFKTSGSGSEGVIDPLKRDVLSLSLDSIKSLKRQLSSSDNAVLDKHLSAIEQVQNGVNSASQCNAPSGIAAAYDPIDPETKLPLIADLAAIAINCDLTRSLAFLVFPDGAGSTVAHTHLYDDFEALYKTRPGVGYHEWTHRRWLSPSNAGNQNTNKCQGAMLASDKWDASIVARFLSKLNPGILEASAFAFGSGGGYAGAHPTTEPEGETHKNIPFVLYGKLNGKLKPQGKTLLREQAVANMWLTLLQLSGSNLTEFGALKDITRTVDLG